MITRLRLQNFRRHEDTVINFTPEQQIVLISGRNGRGKTSILEAITYGFYGQGRNGRKNLDTLVRRGGEAEGLQVELDFTFGGTDYRIVRRREDKVGSAVLTGNGVPLAEGSDLVSMEVAQLLGMDYAGFKLAVIAQQKELDGLASLRSTERALMLSRLLRLDAISKAKDSARKKFRLERDVLKALGSGENVALLRVEAGSIKKNKESYERSLLSAVNAQTDLDAKLLAGKSVQDAWDAAVSAFTRAEGVVDGAKADETRLTCELTALRIPESGEPFRPENIIERELLSLEKEIVQAEAARELLRQREMLIRELGDITTREGSISKEKRELALRVDKWDEKALKRAQEELLQAETLESELREKGAVLKSQRKALKEQLAKAENLPGVCQECGQEVSEEHKHNQLQLALTEQKRVEDAWALAASEFTQVGVIKTALITQVRALEKEEAWCLNATDQLVRLEEEAATLSVRRGTYESQLTRLKGSDVDVNELYAKKADLSLEKSKSKKAEAAETMRREALRTESSLQEQLKRAQERTVLAEEALAQTAPSAELKAAWEERVALLEARDVESSLIASLNTEVAVQTHRLQTADKDVERAEKQLASRQGHEEVATAAANAARLLDDVESRLTTQIRPTLEGNITQILSTLSEGRFSKVSVSAEYDITVEDDGKFRPLTEFSGGEIDLIALSVRLALSAVVSERQGSGIGFLILDECFGSQDPERRLSIMSALRGLKNVYGQILLISHVGGLEDSADMVVNVSDGEDEMGNLTAKVVEND